MNRNYGKINNPLTGKWVSATGKTGKMTMKKYASKLSMKGGSLFMNNSNALKRAGGEARYEELINNYTQEGERSMGNSYQYNICQGAYDNTCKSFCLKDDTKAKFIKSCEDALRNHIDQEIMEEKKKLYRSEGFITKITENDLEKERKELYNRLNLNPKTGYENMGVTYAESK